jgi:hypothetical protein
MTAFGGSILVVSINIVDNMSNGNGNGAIRRVVDSIHDNMRGKCFYCFYRFFGKLIVFTSSIMLLARNLVASVKDLVHRQDARVMSLRDIADVNHYVFGIAHVLKTVIQSADICVDRRRVLGRRVITECAFDVVSHRCCVACKRDIAFGDNLDFLIVVFAVKVKDHLIALHVHRIVIVDESIVSIISFSALSHHVALVDNERHNLTEASWQRDARRNALGGSDSSHYALFIKRMQRKQGG